MDTPSFHQCFQTPDALRPGALPQSKYEFRPGRRTPPPTTNRPPATPRYSGKIEPVPYDAKPAFSRRAQPPDRRSLHAFHFTTACKSDKRPLVPPVACSVHDPRALVPKPPTKRPATRVRCGTMRSTGPRRPKPRRLGSWSSKSAGAIAIRRRLSLAASLEVRRADVRLPVGHPQDDLYTG